MLGHLRAAAQPASSRALGTVRQVQPHHGPAVVWCPMSPRPPPSPCLESPRSARAALQGHRPLGSPPVLAQGALNRSNPEEPLLRGSVARPPRGTGNRVQCHSPNLYREHTQRRMGPGAQGRCRNCPPSRPRAQAPYGGPYSVCWLSSACRPDLPKPQVTVDQEGGAGGLGHQQSSLPPAPPKSGFEALPCPSPLPRWASPAPSTSHSVIQQTSVTISTVPGPPRRS